MTLSQNVFILRTLIVITALTFAVINGYAVLKRHGRRDRAYPFAQIFPLLYIAFTLANPHQGRLNNGLAVETSLLLILATGLAERIANHD